MTVIFTDLVDSTVMSQRLDAQTAEELREAHFLLLQAEVAAVGGMVVKNLGDGLMVICDTPTAALSCAVGMQQAVERSNRRSMESVSMRVGIATGEATESDRDFFGDPVVEAARLCAVARGGQILATDVVRVVAGRHAVQEMTAVGSLELKGLSDPVACVEVLWEPVALAEDAGFPLPARLETASGVGFVGRGAELGKLAEALKGAGSDRRRRLVLVGGEPGIGKSALAAVFARTAQVDGSIVLYGRCDEDLGIPYQPWTEALTHLVDHAPTGLLDEVLASHGGVLARLGPDLARLGDVSLGGSHDAETARYLLYAAVLRVLQAAGGGHPVVVVLDDLHWADIPTLQLLRHLAGWDQELSAVVVATFRDSETGAGHPLAELLASLHREQGVTRLILSGLGDVELLALMEAGVGHAIDDNGLALRDSLAQETDGNPFFVGELLRHLVETGLVHEDVDSRWVVSGDLRDPGLPVSVREVIGWRVARLGTEAVRVLSVASVIGREFDLSVLASAAESAEDTTLDVLDAAVSATLVTNVSGERYSFAHALVEHALYDTLTPARRVRAHRRVAEAIEASCGSDPGSRVGELAHHWAQVSGLADQAKAIGYARAAGNRALAQLAPDEALRWYKRALTVLDHQPDNKQLRAVLLSGLGDAQRQTGHPGFRETLLAAGRLALEVGDTDTLVASALANNRGTFSIALDLDDDRVAIIDAALVAVGDSDSTPRAKLLSLLALERSWEGDYPARKAVSDEALAMARRLGDAPTVLDVLLRRPAGYGVPDTLAERLADTAEAEALADQLGDPISRFWSAVNQMMPAVESADLPLITRCVDSQASLALQIGQPALRWAAIVSQGMRKILAGDAEGAEAFAEQQLRLGSETGQPDAPSFYAAMLGPIRWHQGRLGELIDTVETMAADNPGVPMIRSSLAYMYAEAGRDDIAQALLVDETSAGIPVPDDWMQLCYLTFWAEAAGRVGDPIAADMLYERLASWPDQVAFTGVAIYGSVAHYLGHLASVLRRYDIAEAHFTQALAIHQQLRAPFHQARTHLEWGRMLVARPETSDKDAARTHLESALDLAHRYGCATVEQRANELIGRL